MSCIQSILCKITEPCFNVTGRTGKNWLLSWCTTIRVEQEKALMAAVVPVLVEITLLKPKHALQLVGM